MVAVCAILLSCGISIGLSCVQMATMVINAALFGVTLTAFAAGIVHWLSEEPK